MRLGLALAAATAAAACAPAPPPAAAADSAAAIARTPDGKPDLNGIWQALVPANWDVRPHEARPPPLDVLGAFGAEPPNPGIVEGGEIPYLPAALEQQQQNYANRFELDPERKCFMPGVPRATYMPYPFQILQGVDKILIAYEFAGTSRTIHMNEVADNPTATWMGLSRGRWDGETLVVDVTDFNDQTWFDRAGNFHSDALHVVERYTRVSPYHLMYEATIEDPKVFTRPWKIRMPLYRRLEPDTQILEYKCTEFVEELMYGPLGLVDPATGQVNR
jgi:hypothetical protein